MLKEKFDLTGRVALVTGSARGIGRGYSEALAEYGATTVIADINGEGAEKTAKEIGSRFATESSALEMDVTRTDSVRKAVQETVARYGRLDIAVNNAGVSDTVAAEEMSDATWDRLMSINLRGVFICCREEARAMRVSGGGSIINTASMSALVVNHPQKQAHYNASKAGVVMFTRSVAAEWIGDGIRVNCISPGYIMTEMNRRPQVQELHPFWIERTPIGRLGEVEDLMGAVVFLAADASAFMTGHNLVIDGGYTLW